MKLKQTFILKSLFIILLFYSATTSRDYRVLETLGFTHATSYDLIEIEEDGVTVKKLRVVNSVPKVDPEAVASREILEAVANTSKQARNIMSRQSNRVLVSGQLRSVLFGSTLAAEGIWNHVDTLVRDPAIGLRVRVAIVNGEAADLLREDFPSYPSTGIYIFELLKKESNIQTIPNVNLYHFMRDYYDDGIDPVAPIIKEEQDSITLDGIALFQDDRYVGRFNLDDSLIFAALRENFQDGELAVNLSQQEYLMLSAVSNKRKVNVTKGSGDSGAALKINFHINLSVIILEYVGGARKLSRVDEQERLAEEIEEYVKKKAMHMINTAQKIGADCFGIGQYVRNSLSAKEWMETDWRAVYPHIETDVLVNVKIRNYGTNE